MFFFLSYQSINFFAFLFLKATDTLTVIVGADSDGRKIVTFDWTTMLYQVQPAKFSGDRILSSCGLLRNKYNQFLVAVAGERQNAKSLYRFNLAQEVISAHYGSA